MKSNESKYKELQEKEYAWVNQNMPDATPEEKEETVRKRIFKRKMKRIGIILLFSCVGWGVALLPFSKGTMLEALGVAVGGLCQIIAGMQFAKTLHDPLTDVEAAEFRVNDFIEKTGKSSENDSTKK